MHSEVINTLVGKCPGCSEHNFTFFSYRSSGNQEKMAYTARCAVCQSEEYSTIKDLGSEVRILCKECNNLLFCVIFSEEELTPLFCFKCKSCGLTYHHNLEVVRRQLEGDIHPPKFRRMDCAPN